MRVHWVPDTQNWGDIFTPLLLETLGFRNVEWSYQAEAEVFCCGSLLERVPEDFTGYILGSGAGYDETSRNLTQVKQPLMLRGHLTANNCEYDGEVVLGDPGLLASWIYPIVREKKYRYGIVPHGVDHGHYVLNEWTRDNTLVVNINGGIVAVMDQIAQCEQIVSSALHGLVIANSLKVPSCWIELSGKYSKFKFHDYYSVYDAGHLEPYQDLETAFHNCWVPDVSEVTSNVLKAFHKFRGVYEDCVNV